MGINSKEQMEIYNIITHHPDCVDWRCIGRYEPSPEAYSDAANFMPKGSGKHEEMKTALLRAFPIAKEIRYHRQLKLLALVFDTNANGIGALNMLKLAVQVREGVKL